MDKIRAKTQRQLRKALEKAQTARDKGAKVDEALALFHPELYDCTLGCERPVATFKGVEP